MFQERNILYLNGFSNKFSSGSTTSLSKTVSRFTGLKAKFSKALF